LVEVVRVNASLDNFGQLLQEFSVLIVGDDFIFIEFPAVIEVILYLRLKFLIIGSIVVELTQGGQEQAQLARLLKTRIEDLHLLDHAAEVLHYERGQQNSEEKKDCAHYSLEAARGVIIAEADS